LGDPVKWPDRETIDRRWPWRDRLDREIASMI
jgi:hypothetical protein